MKNILIIIVLYAFLPLLLLGQQRWEVIIEKQNMDYNVTSTTYPYDAGIILNAKTDWFNNWIIKTNTNGEKLWEKLVFSDNKPMIIYKVMQNQNGEILICGAVDSHAFVLLLDGCGNLLWCNEYINYEHYSESVHLDALFLNNGNIILLTSLYGDINYGYDVGLISFDSDGNLLWFKPYNLLVKYELLDMAVPLFIDSFDEFLIISGWCYYAYPDNPSVVWLRPLFIKTKSDYSEDWFLPYGMEDSIIGDARGAISFNGEIIQGYGMYHKSGTINSILMNFDTVGNETEYIGIDNTEIGVDIDENFFLRLEIRDDTSYIASAKFGNNGMSNPMGEWVMDSSGNVYQDQSHPNTTFSPLDPLFKTSNDKFVFAYQYNSSDILLYKLNADLSQAEIDTTTYTYDSLCNNLPIISDTIYLDNCSIVTGIDEAPTPEEYYASLKTINIVVMPNPATDVVVFEIGVRGYNGSTTISCYDVNGRKVFNKILPQNQTKIATDVTNWQSSIYIVVASGGNGSKGESKFVVTCLD